MKVHVPVRVDVIERQARGAKGRELGADLARELILHVAPEEKAETRANKARAKGAVRANEIGDFRGRQHRRAVDEDKVQADMEVGQAPRARHRVGCRRRPDHETCRGENAVAAATFDRLVDGLVQSEIVSADDEPPEAQCAISRSRRNWKNSTPSRRRRRIISGLRTISPTIEAILPARK